MKATSSVCNFVTQFSRLNQPLNTLHNHTYAYTCVENVHAPGCVVCVFYIQTLTSLENIISTCMIRSACINISLRKRAAWAKYHEENVTLKCWY